MRTTIALLFLLLINSIQAQLAVYDPKADADRVMEGIQTALDVAQRVEQLREQFQELQELNRSLAEVTEMVFESPEFIIIGITENETMGAIMTANAAMGRVAGSQEQKNRFIQARDISMEAMDGYLDLRNRVVDGANQMTQAERVELLAGINSEVRRIREEMDSWTRYFEYQAYLQGLNVVRD